MFCWDGLSFPGAWQTEGKKGLEVSEKTLREFPQWTDQQDCQAGWTVLRRSSWKDLAGGVCVRLLFCDCQE